MWYRYITPPDEIPDGFKMPFYPWPCVIQLVVFLFIFIATENYVIDGGVPILELSLLFLLLGVAMYMMRARVRREWPFDKETSASVKSDSSKSATSLRAPLKRMFSSTGDWSPSIDTAASDSALKGVKYGLLKLADPSGDAVEEVPFEVAGDRLQVTVKMDRLKGLFQSSSQEPESPVVRMDPKVTL